MICSCRQLIFSSNDHSIIKPLLPTIIMKEEPHKDNQKLDPKTLPCKQFRRGECRYGDRCKFSHRTIKCYMLRHAESAFNQMMAAFEGQENGSQAREKFQLNRDFVDCGLTEKGIGQVDSIVFPEELTKGGIKFDIIFVSPLERCLKTLERCLNKHKIKAKKIIVLNELTEVLSKICDIGHSMEYKKKKYTQYDFSYAEMEKKQWQDELVDPQFRDRIDEKEEFQGRYFGILNEIFPQPLEDRNRCFRRTLKAMDTITKLCLSQKMHKILIVTHNRIIRNILGSRNKHLREEKVQNCQIRYIQL